MVLVEVVLQGTPKDLGFNLLFLYLPGSKQKKERPLIWTLFFYTKKPPSFCKL